MAEEADTAQGESGLRGFIERNRERILSRWELTTRKAPEALPLSSRTLRDHIPQLLERIGQLVELPEESRLEVLEDVPSLHALERLDVGFDLQHVTDELALLRTILLELWEQQVSPDTSATSVVREIRILNQAIDEVVGASVSAFAKARQRTLVALERISAAALGTGDLQTFVPRLLSVLLETTAAADTVKVFLREDDALVLMASAGAGGAETSLRLQVGEGFVGAVGKAGAPMLLHHACTDPIVRDPEIRSRGIKALYGVPLIHEGRVIGVAEMGSRTAFDFSPDDKQLFRAMVQRATSIIAQAQLIAREREAHAEARAAARRAEQEHQLLDAVLEAAPVGIMLADREGKLLRANLYSETIWGALPWASNVEEYRDFRAVWLEGSKQGQRVEPQDWPMSRALHGETVPGARVEIEPFAPHPEKKVISICGAPVRDASGEIVGGVVAQVDVTAQEKAEAALRASEERLRRLANAVPGMLFESAAAGENLWMSDSWFLYTGLPPEKTRGWGWLEALHPEDRAEFESHWRGALREGTDVEARVRLRARDESYRWFLLRAVPDRDAQGAVTRWFASISDVDALTRVERTLEESRDFERELIGIVSHDLRTPLTAILMAANIILRRHDIDNRLRGTTERIITAGNRASRMIRDLLDFAQARGAAVFPIHRQRLRLADFVDQVVQEIQLGNPDRNIRISEDGDTYGEWDPDRIAQIISNIVGNAVAHSPSGTAVDVRVEGEPDMVVLHVHNEGEPIPNEELPRLFAPYRRGKDAEKNRARQGIGLGLFITKALIDAKGGSITVDSAEERGTTFIIRLPRHPRSA